MSATLLNFEPQEKFCGVLGVIIELVKLIRERRTIHDFKKGEIAEEIFNQALQLVSYAPNHKNTQPWRLVRMGLRGRQQLADLEVEYKKKKSGQDLTMSMQDKIREKFMNPAEILVLAQTKSADSLRAKEDFAALAMAVQNMQLFLWSNKIGSKWSTGSPTRDERVYKIANLDPLNNEIQGYFLMGIPQSIPEPPPKAKLNQILTEVD